MAGGPVNLALHRPQVDHIANQIEAVGTHAAQEGEQILGLTATAAQVEIRQPQAAAVVVDAMVRLIPGVISDETSALTDSFQDDLLAPPVYTRPADFRGLKVPEILLSGDLRKVEEWRFEQALQRTRERRPDMLGE